MSSRSSNSTSSPPQFPGYHCVGWIQSAHGIRGELFFRFHAGQADWSDSVETFHLLTRTGSKLEAFEIGKMKPHKDGMIVTLEGVKDRNRAEELAKSSVYIDRELLQAEEGDRVFLDQLLGFKVMLKDGPEVGVIQGFATNGPQDLLRVVNAGGAEALIPLVDAFLVDIDFDKQQVTMDLPPGLVDLEEE